LFTSGPSVRWCTKTCADVAKADEAVGQGFAEFAVVAFDVAFWHV